MLRQAHEDLETKVPVVSTETVPERKEVATQTISKINEVLNMKQEESNANIGEKKIEIPCKYFNSLKGCRRGKKCWFYHGQGD